MVLGEALAGSVTGDRLTGHDLTGREAGGKGRRHSYGETRVMLKKRRNVSCATLFTSVVIAGLATAFGCSDSEATPPPPAAATATGNAGESCLRRADCETGLSCIDNKCTSGDASVALGAIGETCAARADCELGLGCIDRVCTPPDQVST